VVCIVDDGLRTEYLFNSNYSRVKAISLCSAVVLLFGGLEALLILTLRVMPLTFDSGPGYSVR
jgi:hypothetical protein